VVVIVAERFWGQVAIEVIMSKEYGEPVVYRNDGYMLVTGVMRDYPYRGVTKDIYTHACYLSGKERFKEMWNYLKPYAVEIGIDEQSNEVELNVDKEE